MIGLILLAALASCVLFPLIVLAFSIRNLRRVLQTPGEPADSIEALRRNAADFDKREGRS